MALYEAAILDLAQPVKPTIEKKQRKQTKPKRIPAAAQEVEAEPNPEADQPGSSFKCGNEEPAVENKPVKEKKPRTEKQIAAFARVQETRRLKKEAAEQELADKQADLEATELAIEAQEEKIRARKIAAAEKRRLKRTAVAADGVVPQAAKGSQEGKFDPVATLEANGANVNVFEKRAAKKRKVSPNEKSTEEPPTWFKSFVTTTERERAKINPAERKPQRQITEEAGALASAHWNDGLTRDRVQEEVNNHMKRLMHATQKPVFSRRMR